MRVDGELYIAGTGIFLPPRYNLTEAVSNGLYSTAELNKSQLESVAISEDIYPPDMAILAAKEALEVSGQTPDDIAITLHAYLAFQGLAGWHAASYVHRHSVGNNAPAIEIRQMSNGGLAAISLAICYLRASPHHSAAMVTTSDRFVDVPGGRWAFDEGLVPGDGATACIVSKTQGFARILNISMHSDTTLEAYHRGNAPFCGDPSYLNATTFRDRRRQYLTQEYKSGAGGKQVYGKFFEGVSAVVERALGETQRDKSVISRWILPNFGLRQLEEAFIRPLGIDHKCTTWSWGRTVGHLGAGDHIAALHHLRMHDLLVPGQILALVGVGAGFNWSCALVEIL